MEKNNPPGWLFERKLPAALAVLFLFARMITLLALPFEGVLGYGDFRTYYLTAALPGWPFIHYWVEYPPLFSFLSAVLFRIASGQQHIYVYLLEFILLLANAGSIFLFSRLALRLHPLETAAARCVLYLVVLVSLAYGWWFFDPLVVFLMLLGITLVIERKLLGAGLAVGLGIIAKFFPGLALLAAWGRLSWKQFALLTCLSLLPMLVTYGLLWQASPTFTEASFRSQMIKGSWETIWALLDGNLHTGSFGPIEERLEPAMALASHGNRAVIPPFAILPVFAGLGLLGMRKIWPQAGRAGPSDRQSIALIGFGWGLFLLWSPGWSPQWALYLLPLILLAMPLRQGVLFCAVLVMVNLLEWPVLLSRGLFSGLWVTILLRTLVLAVMTASFYPVMAGDPVEPGGAVESKTTFRDGIID